MRPGADLSEASGCSSCPCPLKVFSKRYVNVEVSKQQTVSAKRPPSKNRLGRAQRRICRPYSQYRRLQT